MPPESPIPAIHSPRGHFGVRHRTLSGKALHRYVSARSVLGVSLLAVALLVFGQLGAHPRQQTTVDGVPLVHPGRPGSSDDAHEGMHRPGNHGSDADERLAHVLAEGRAPERADGIHSQLQPPHPPPKPKEHSNRIESESSLFAALRQKRQAVVAGAEATSPRKVPPGHAAHVKGGSARSARGKAGGGQAAAAVDPLLSPRTPREEDVFFPLAVGEREWFEWDQSTAHEYVSNLTNICSRMPWELMHHGDKEDFFKDRPACRYLNSCDGELPPVEESKVSMEYAGYIEQYSDKIRYMHMAMLAQLPTGTFLSAWQASPIVLDDLQEQDRLAIEGLDLQHIRMSYSKDTEGRLWSASKRVPIPQKAALWSPVLHVDHAGRAWLFYSESAACRKSHVCNPCVPRLRHPCRQKALWETEICLAEPAMWTPGGHIKVMTSDSPLAADPKWSSPRLLLSMQSGGGIPKVICNRMIVLSSGEWLLPYWREQTPGAVEDGTCRSHTKEEIEVEVLANGEVVKEMRQPPPGSDCYADQATPCNTGAREYSGVLRSTDHGKTWKARGTIMLPNTHLIEGTAAEMRNGSVLMIFRTQAGCLYSSTSDDKGLTWSPTKPMAIPNPNSKVHLMRMEPSGHLLLAFNNHRNAGGYKGLKNCRSCRSRLHIAMSIDDAETWQHVVSLDDELSSSAVRIHYPCMLQVKGEDRLLVVYTRFYLGRKMGLTSPDQGVVVMKLNFKGVMDNLPAIFGASPA